MSRPGAWSKVWSNFIASISPKTRTKIYKGEDLYGNRYFEYSEMKANIKRGYETPETVKNPQPPTIEWDAWLRSRRRFPPSDEEIRLNLMKQQYQLLQDTETEKRAPKIGSHGKGAAEIDRKTEYPAYEDAELSPGVKNSLK